jgi:tetratricopeptide (TPR) repeat protein
LIANDYQNLGIAEAQAGHIAGALRSQRRALAYFEALMRTNPNDWQAVPRLARGYNQVGELLLKLGDVTTALDHFRQAVSLVERTLSQGSTTPPMRRQLALGYFHIGQTYATMATRAGTPAAVQHERWREARQAYQHSLELWQELQRNEALPPDYASKPDESSRALARCDAALGKLR